MEKTEENGNVGWTVQCRHSISKAVQESAHIYNEWQTYLASTKPYLFTHPNPTNAIISWMISLTISWQIVVASR